MQIFTNKQKAAIAARKLKIGSLYMLPRWGFSAYDAPNGNSCYIDTNPLTKSLDYELVELLGIERDFAHVRFIKGNRHNFWLRAGDLKYRGMMERGLLTLVMFIPYVSYNIYDFVKSKYWG